MKNLTNDGHSSYCKPEIVITAIVVEGNLAISNMEILGDEKDVLDW